MGKGRHGWVQLASGQNPSVAGALRLRYARVLRPYCTHYPNPFPTAGFSLTPILNHETLSLYASAL